VFEELSHKKGFFGGGRDKEVRAAATEALMAFQSAEAARGARA